jgi:hypothetical protein
VIGGRKLGCDQVHFAAVDKAFAAVEGDRVPFPDGLAARGLGLGFAVDVDLLCPNDAALATAAPGTALMP